MDNIQCNNAQNTSAKQVGIPKTDTDSLLT